MISHHLLQEKVEKLILLEQFIKEELPENSPFEGCDNIDLSQFSTEISNMSIYCLESNEIYKNLEDALNKEEKILRPVKKISKLFKRMS